MVFFILKNDVGNLSNVVKRFKELALGCMFWRWSLKRSLKQSNGTKGQKAREQDQENLIGRKIYGYRCKKTYIEIETKSTKWQTDWQYGQTNSDKGVTDKFIDQHKNKKTNIRTYLDRVQHFSFSEKVCYGVAMSVNIVTLTV